MACLQIKYDVSHLVELATPLEEAANKLGIFNVFDDGGYRDMLMLTMFGLKRIGGRLGDDAIAEDGTTYELKTVNLVNTKGEAKNNWPGVTTEHTLTLANLERYRKAQLWIIGVFRANDPLVVYELPTEALEPYFLKWEEQIRRTGNPINNPKIPMGYVIKYGTCHNIPGITENAKLPRSAKYRELLQQDRLAI